MLTVGETLEVAAPRGAFVLKPGDRAVVLASAGVGATPVLAMLHALSAERSRRQVWWLHGTRNRAEHSFADEVDELLALLPNAHRLVCYSSPGPSDRKGIDFDVRGRVTASVLDDGVVPTDGAFYLCGPSPFMHDVGAALAARGVTPDRINAEVFGPNDPITPGIVGATRRPPHSPDGPPGPGPAISFSRSNLSVPWDPGFNSLLELAEACDVPVRWSCRSGVCHTCETGLLSGAVNYLPDPVESPGPGNAYLCCSRPQTDVVLDL
jgi:ferredoxin-NADP reductase